MGIKLIGGRDFSTEYSTDTSTYLINEAAARKIGYQEPVDKEMTMWNRKGKIIGSTTIARFTLPLNPYFTVTAGRWDTITNWGSVLVRARPGQTKQALTAMEASFKRFNSYFPFKYALSTLMSFSSEICACMGLGIYLLA